MVKIAKDEVISYKPKEYVYTGATVGGVTTGGIHEQGGYNYVSGYRDTGRYQLQYEDEKFRRYLITKIQLSDELYNKAKESPIKDYLDNEKKQIKVVEELRPSSVVRQQMEMGNFQTARQIFANEMVEGYPTYDKCQKIINWLKA